MIWLVHLVSWLSPDEAVLLLTGGVLLIYWELNRPGSVLPGALGVLATLLAVASLLHHALNLAAIVLVLSAAALLLVNLLRPTTHNARSFLLAAAATLALVVGFAQLLARSGQAKVSLPVAIGCGTLLAAGTSLLTRIARCARLNKGLD